MKHENIEPPKFAQRLLFHMLESSERDNILGDFAEFYHEKHQEENTFKANSWYWKQVAKSFPKFLFNSIYWSFEMFKNYLKISLRNIRKNILPLKNIKKSF